MAFPFLLNIHTFPFFLSFVVKSPLTPQPVCWEAEAQNSLCFLSSEISVGRLHLLTNLSLHLAQFHSGGANYCCIKTTLQQGKQEREAPRISTQRSTVPCRATTTSRTQIFDDCTLKQRVFFSDFPVVRLSGAHCSQYFLHLLRIHSWNN